MNERPVDIDFTVNAGDFVSQTVHMHEIPIIAAPLEVVYEDENFLAFNKPPSMPVSLLPRPHLIFTIVWFLVFRSMTLTVS